MRGLHEQQHITHCSQKARLESTACSMPSLTMREQKCAAVLAMVTYSKSKSQWQLVSRNWRQLTCRAAWRSCGITLQCDECVSFDKQHDTGLHAHAGLVTTAHAIKIAVHMQTRMNINQSITLKVLGANSGPTDCQIETDLTVLPCGNMARETKLHEAYQLEW